MKIERVRVHNLKRIADLDMVPGDASLIIVGGENGAGKTTALDSIIWTLGGARLIQDKPLRRGASEGYGEVRLSGGWTVRRSFDSDGDSVLEIRNDEMELAAPRKPQGWLDSLVGPISYDPVAFQRMTRKEQGETLRQLVGLDLSEIDQKREYLADLRRDAKKERDRLEGNLLTTPEVDAPSETVSVTGLSERLREAMASNAQRESLLHALDRAANRVMTAQGVLDRLRAEVARAEAAVHEAEQAEDRATKAVEAAPAVIAIGEIQAEIAAAEDTNTRVRAKRERAKLIAAAASARRNHQDLEEQVKAADAARTRAIAEADFPVPGLAFAEDGSVLFEGLPFGQASDAEQLRISIGIGLALHPELKVLLIRRDGSLLDSKSLAIADRMVRAKGGQVWIERVVEDDSQPVTFWLHEGKLAKPVSAEERAALQSTDNGDDGSG
jgi:hypothetical protein